MRSVLIVALLAVGLGGCNWTKPRTPAADERSAKEKLAHARRLKRACGSPETYDRLKAVAFDEAAKLSRGRSAALDAIASSVTVRMENPVAKSRDNELDVTICEGRLVLDLPPGLEDAFDGDRRLTADVEYAAQAAVDGSGLVYQMQGAEPIIYRLAALTLRAPRPSAPAVATAAPDQSDPAGLDESVASGPTAPVPPRRAPPPAAPEPVPQPRAAVEPAPARRAAAARPSFNCRGARSRVERMICSDPALAAQDRRMSSAFYAALARGDGETRAALRASRDRWLAFRERCPTAACVSQAYADREAEISDIVAGR